MEDSYNDLVAERTDILKQVIDYINEYKGLETGSQEAEAILTTIASLTVRLTQVQHEILSLIIPKFIT